MSTTQTLATENRSLEMKTAIWVAAIASTALIFDGYDLVVFGTVMPTLMNDPSQIGPLDPSIVGTVGSLALIGVLLGSYASGFIGDILGRKRMLMIGIAWFSIGMALTAPDAPREELIRHAQFATKRAKFSPHLPLLAAKS